MDQEKRISIGLFQRGKQMEREVSDAPVNGAGAKVISFDSLSSADRISVHTARSNYQFSVLDPFTRKGTLTGGLLGDQTLIAVFSGALSEDRTYFDSAELKPGSRAVFFVETGDQARRLITSVITDIDLNRDCECAA